jgi:hypothetical protein
MSDYLAKKIGHDFLVDGSVTKVIWAQANWSRPFVDMATGEKAEFSTQSAIVWSDSHLYIAFKAEEPDLQADLTVRDSLIFLENDLELFIDGRDAYYELEVNARNTIYEVFFIWRDAFTKGGRFPSDIFDISQPDVYTFGGDYDRTGASFWVGTHPRGTRWAFKNYDLPGLKTAVSLQGTLNDPSDIDEGWSLEIAIPWESLIYLADGRSLPPANGDIWKFFLGRFQKKMVDGREVSPHPASALRPHGVYDTHLPEEWSEITFVE